MEKGVLGNQRSNAYSPKEFKTPLHSREIVVSEITVPKTRNSQQFLNFPHIVVPFLWGFYWN